MATITYQLSGITNKSTGKSEIKIRLTHGHFTQRAKTGLFVDKQYWEPEENYQNVPGRIRIPQIRGVITSDKKELLSELKSVENKLAELDKYLTNEFLSAGFENVKDDKKWLQRQIDKFQNRTSQNDVSFFGKFDEYIEQSESTEGRKRHYRVVYRLLKRFEIITGREITFKGLTPDTLIKFKEFLINEHTYCDDDSYSEVLAQVNESRKPKPRGGNTIAALFKVLRAFIRWSEQCKDNDPFKVFKIEDEVYNKTPYYLTVAERNSLYEFDFSHNKRLERQRDIFIFQCCVGARVDDFWHFTKENLVDDGVIEYIPRKTLNKNPVVARIPLIQTAKNILDKYKNYEGKQLFPFTAQQHYNDDIKELLKIAGINRVVTTLNPVTREYEQHPIWEVASSHLARRTFIGNLYKKVQDPNLIGSMSGHKPGSTAFARYRAIDDDIKKSVLSKIE